MPFDPEAQIYLEYDGYTNETVKQADVILLGYPLNIEMSQQIKENNLKFYAQHTDPQGPAMTWGMFCINSLQTNPTDLNSANNFFQRSYIPNLNGPFLVWSEVAGGAGGGHFITGTGSFLQALLNGFGSLLLTEQGLSINNPILPSNTSFLRFRGIDFRGHSLNIYYDQSVLEITETSNLLSALSIRTASGDILSLGSDRLTFALKSDFPLLIY